jgi:2-polyprenyl-3-methyl-5-hydroxy-6-metoxy-1,4-benzoquinol methylase
MLCPICQSEKTFLKYPANLDEAGKNYRITDSRFGVHGDIYQCRTCLVAWVAEVALVEQAVASYGAESFDEVYEQERSNRKKTAEILVKKIKKIKAQGKLLDIGCYSGIFLEAAKEAGYEIFGIEASESALAVARQKTGGDLRVGLAEEVLAQFPDNYFDIITLFDVIEHLRLPGPVLALINSKLKTDGLLVFSTPDAASLLAKIQGKNWHIILPHHLYYFSEKNLKMLLEQNGLRQQKIGYIGRHFTLDYLAGQTEGINRPLAKALIGAIKFFRLGKITVPINLFDQLLIFARKK